jgi:hypothetical protein
MTGDLPPALDAAHLTAALRQAGVLGEGGRVVNVVIESQRPTVLSRIMRLELAYEGDAGGAPRSLFAKTGLPERAELGWHGATRELAFYAQVAATMQPLLTPRCFAAHADEVTKSWHLVLEDLNATHRPVGSEWPLPPDMATCERVVVARARFHAAWWNDPRLGATIGASGDATAVDAYWPYFAAQLPRFIDRLGDNLPRERRDLYDRLLAAGPGLSARRIDRGGLTIAQGDSHIWNCMLPRDGGDDVRIIDWDAWRVASGTSDLAYMMAVQWYPDWRRHAEPLLLDRYHEALLAHGVRGYDRAALAADYRLSTLHQLATPVLQEAYGVPALYWWNNLQRVLLAIDDLGCRDLLD